MPLRHRTLIVADDKADPLFKLLRQNLAKAHVDYPEWDFMDRMEFLDPWNLDDDPWEISGIKSHRCHPSYVGSDMELLIKFQCDQEEQWIPYHKVLEDEPWLVAQYIVANKLKYRHRKRYQLDWAKQYIKSVDKISLRHFNINVTDADKTPIPEYKIQFRRVYVMKQICGLPSLLDTV